MWTSWPINLTLLILHPIYSIPFNLSIKPNPTVLRLLQPQLHSYSARYCHRIRTRIYGRHLDVQHRAYVRTGQPIPCRVIFYGSACDPNAHHSTHALLAQPYHFTTHTDIKHIVYPNISPTMRLTDHATHRPCYHANISTCYRLPIRISLLLKYKLSYLSCHIRNRRCQ